jgi:serine/threonine-protein kinase
VISVSSSVIPETERTATLSSYRRVCGIAAGGVGTVELALREEGRFRRLYAVKRLHDAYRGDADFRAMFLDEARIAGLVRHPNVVSVLDVGEDARGPFLVMDYVEGVSAAVLVTSAVESGVVLPLQVCLRIVMQAAEGLHAAHELRDARGRQLELVHRDVSPQNLLVGFDGITRVTDFGIAKAFGRSTQTQTGVLKGKFGYMSPEQLRFEEPDRRSDIFSLGIVFFELAAGERLYKNQEGMDGARRILTEPAPDLGDYRDDVPADLVQLLFSMLAKDVEHRPPDAKTVARTIERLLASLAEEEGRLDVAEFLQTAFAVEREMQQSKIEMALGTATGTLETISAADGAITTADASPRGRRGIALAALVAAFVAVAAIAWWAASDGEGGESGRANVGTAAAPPTETAESTEAETAESTEAETAAATEATAATPAAPEADPPAAIPGAEPAEASNDRPTKRRRPRRRTKQRTEGAAGVPMWDWQ